MQSTMEFRPVLVSGIALHVVRWRGVRRHEVLERSKGRLQRRRPISGRRGSTLERGHIVKGESNDRFCSLFNYRHIIKGKDSNFKLSNMHN